MAISGEAYPQPLMEVRPLTHMCTSHSVYSLKLNTPLLEAVCILLLLAITSIQEVTWGTCR